MIEFYPVKHMKRRVCVAGDPKFPGMVMGTVVGFSIDYGRGSVIEGLHGSYSSHGVPRVLVDVQHDGDGAHFVQTSQHDQIFLTLIDEAGKMEVGFEFITIQPKPLQPENQGMNLSTAVLLMNDKCRVIEAIYCPDAEGDQRDAQGKPKAKRELFKTFDDMIKVDDLLIVPSSTRLKITTVKVTDVDVDWDPDTSTEIKWIIGTVDMAGFEELKALDEKMFKVIKDAEKTDKRNKLREKLTAHMDDTQKAELLSMTDSVAITHQPETPPSPAPAAKPNEPQF